MIKLDNGIISLSVEERGAQMRSLCDVESGREYLWQADSEIWGRTAPVLFPAVGAVHTEGYIYKDKRYPMPKHGFARDFDFEPVEKTPQSLVLALYPNDKIKQMYPFDFVFRARFALSGRTLSFSYEAENIGTETMYFSLGAHPGFACAFSDRIVFEKREPTAALFCGADDRPNKSAAPFVMDESGEIVLSEDFFSDGSLAFPSVESERVCLVRDGKTYLKMNFGKVPHLWLWSKAGAAFVCIEPWHGADECVPEERLEMKKGIISLHAGEKFVFPITVEI